MNSVKDYIEKLVPEKEVILNNKKYILESYLSQYKDGGIYELYREIVEELPRNIQSQTYENNDDALNKNIINVNKKNRLITYVIIEPYNNNKILKCLNLLSNQIYKNIEIITIYTCRNNNKKNIYIKSNILFKNINLYEYKSKKEMIEIALEISEGEYVCIIDIYRYLNKDSVLDIAHFLKNNKSDIICYTKDYNCFSPIIKYNLVDKYNLNITDCCIRRDVLLDVLPLLKEYEDIITDIIIHKCICLNYKLEFLYQNKNKDFYNQIFDNERWKPYLSRTFDSLNIQKLNYIKNFAEFLNYKEILFLDLALNNKVVGNFPEKVIKKRLKRVITNINFELYLIKMLYLNYIEQLITMIKCFGVRFSEKIIIDTALIKDYPIQGNINFNVILEHYLLNFEKVEVNKNVVADMWKDLNAFRNLLNYIWYRLYPKTCNKNKVIKIYIGIIKNYVNEIISSSQIITLGRIQILLVKRRFINNVKR